MVYKIISSSSLIIAIYAIDEHAHNIKKDDILLYNLENIVIMVYSLFKFH